MKKAILQAVVACVVLAATRNVANAATVFLNGTNEFEVTDVMTQTWAATDDLNIGSVNHLAGANTWDGVLRIHSGGTGTCNVIFMTNGGDQTAGKIIVDGTGSTMIANGKVSLAMNSAPGIYRTPLDALLSLDEPCLIEITNGGKFFANTADTPVGTGQGGSFGPSWGMVTVDGAGSEFVGVGGMRIGQGGSGTVTITNTGKVTAGICYIGLNEFGVTNETVGILNVDGAGSEFNAEQLNMGSPYSESFLNITGGGKVAASFMNIAWLAGLGSATSGDCEILVTGAGSVLDVFQSGGDSMHIGGTLVGGPLASARVTLEEGGNIEAEGLVTIYDTATLVFGLGNGPGLHSDDQVFVHPDDHPTIVITPDAGFLGALGVPYDLITASVAVNADPGNLVLDLSALDVDSTAAGVLALNGGGTALQLILTNTGREQPTLTQADDVNATSFDFDSVLDFEYGVEWSTNLVDWVFNGMTVIGNGGTMSVFDPTGTDADKSYRLAIFQP
jgi:T5SS/PEP-CTERM-associated repeat protein